MVDRSYREALTDNELVVSNPGPGQEAITGAEVFGATSAALVDSGILFSELQKWVLTAYGADAMLKSVYDPNDDGIVNAAAVLDDTVNSVTAAQARTHIDDGNLHFLLNDTRTNTLEVWSSSKIDGELAGKVEEAPATSARYSRRQNAWIESPETPTGGMTFRYTFQSSTTGADPGSGNIRANNSNLQLASALYVSATNRDGNSAEVAWDVWDFGDFIAIANDLQAERAVYQIAGQATNNDGWYSLPVTALPGPLTSLSNQAPVQVMLVPDPASRVPRGGNAGQILSKLSNVDFDMQWIANTGGGGDVEEAPQDGTGYIRRDAGWVSGSRVYQQGGAPASPAIGDIWIDTT